MIRVKIKNLTKKFKLYHGKPALIRKVLPFVLKPILIEDLIAIDDLSFEVKDGECTGIVGSNGAGKSTLLQVLAGLTTYKQGSIEINGSVSTLLELGSGFHPELTGEENIYLNSTLIGLSKKVLEEKYDEIVKFAGLEKFIDSKLRVYSDGMKIRLGFSIVAQQKFEILLIDEIISVGDIEFQKKCFDLFDKYLNEGKTIIVASHDINTLRRICHKILWIEKGKKVKEGPASEILDEYEMRKK